jgi:hypothetical protein
MSPKIRFPFIFNTPEGVMRRHKKVDTCTRPNAYCTVLYCRAILFILFGFKCYRAPLNVHSAIKLLTQLLAHKKESYISSKA